MQIDNPLSDDRYETSIDGLKRWAANELPHGLPLAYAVAGLVTITALLLIQAGLITAFTPFSLTTPYAYACILLLAAFWAYGGWIHGRHEENTIYTTPSNAQKLDYESNKTD